MTRIFLVLLLGATLAGCATHTARTADGYAMPRDTSEAERRAAKQVDDLERSEVWSVRDFAYPRGLVW